MLARGIADGSEESTGTRVDHETRERQSRRPDSVGRYEILEILGEGGMGIVYAAYDTELERRVALKLVRPGSLQHAHAERLEWEARAMARINDPHVATVYEVGRLEDEVYVAMEMIEGATLDRWVQEHDLSGPEILELCVQAGRGLAAIHHAGLAHRDFKPANVVVRDTVRGPVATVIDLGLSLVEPVVPAELTTARDEPETTSVAGTPAYMAPEQWEGLRPGPLSDQFSFCVSTFELLTSTRPFPCPADGAVRPHAPLPSSGTLTASGISRRKAAAILRGLRGVPSRRWPELDLLLRALGPSPRRRRWWAAAGAAGLGAWAAIASFPAAPKCGVGDTSLGRVWNETTRDGISQRLSATDERVASRFLSAADVYVEQWVREYEAACEEPEASVHQRDCLEAQLSALRASIDVLSDSAATTAEQSLDLARVLPAVSGCAGAELGDGEHVDPDSRYASEVLLLKGRAYGDSGEFDAATTALSEAIRRGGSTDGRLVTRALLLRGDMVFAAGLPNAEGDWTAALSEARRLHASGLAAQAGIRLSGVVQRREARRLAQQAVHDARDAGVLALEVEALTTHGRVLAEWLEYGEALEAYEHAAEALDAMPNPDAALRLELGLARGHTLFNAGHSEEGLSLVCDVVEQSLVLLGPHAEVTIDAQIGCGLLSFGRREQAQVEAYLRDAFMASRRGPGLVHQEAAASRALGSVLLRPSGSADNAPSPGMNHVRFAESRYRAMDDKYELGRTLVLMGEHARNRGRFEESLQLQHEGIRVSREASGSGYPKLARAELSLGLALLGLGRVDEAAVQIERGASVLGSLQDPTEARFAHDMRGILARVRGLPMEAVEHHRHALEALDRADAGEVLPQTRTPTLLQLARALLAADQQAEARAIVSQASQIERAVPKSRRLEEIRELQAEVEAADLQLDGVSQ